MRLFTLIVICLWWTCCSSRSWRGGGSDGPHGLQRGGGHQQRRGRHQRGSFRQLKHLQDHGVNLDHLDRGFRSPGNLDQDWAEVQAPKLCFKMAPWHINKDQRSTITAFDLKTATQARRMRRRAESRWRVRKEYF